MTDTAKRVPKEVIDFLERHWGNWVQAVGKKRAAEIVERLKHDPD